MKTEFGNRISSAVSSHTEKIWEVSSKMGAAESLYCAPVMVDEVGVTEITVPSRGRKMNVVLIGGGGSATLIDITFDVKEGEKYSILVGGGGNGDTSISRDGVVIATAKAGMPRGTTENGVAGVSLYRWSINSI